MSDTEPKNPPPKGWPRISSGLTYDDPRAAIDWLCRAFGFVVRIKVEGDDGAIHHSELTYGDGLVMASGPRDEPPHDYMRAPTSVGGGNTQTLFCYVDDIEAHFRRAKEAGARIVKEPATVDYGEGYWVDRGYTCADLGGHHWHFAQRLEG